MKQFLIGTDNGNIIGYQLDYDPKKDQITEKSVNLITLKGSIYGIGVLVNNNSSKHFRLRTMTK
jgi:hypothetical protein